MKLGLTFASVARVDWENKPLHSLNLNKRSSDPRLGTSPRFSYILEHVTVCIVHLYIRFDVKSIPVTSNNAARGVSNGAILAATNFVMPPF